MEELQFKLEAFEGPLDLLLKLIEKNKVSILDIPIALILDQYMAHIDAMRAMDMDVAGEFIVMAAELMLIKSKMLLPKKPEAEEEDPRARLAAALLEYQKAKEFAAALGQRYARFDGRIVKDPEVIEADVELAPHSAALLESAFRRILARNRALAAEEGEKPRPERLLTNILVSKPVSIPAKILGVMRLLYRRGDTDLDQLLLTAGSRGELIALFMALLELLHAQRISLIETDFDEHYLVHLDRTRHNRT